MQHNGRKEEKQVEVRERKEREAAAKRREVRLQAAYLEQLSLAKEV